MVTQSDGKIDIIWHAAPRNGEHRAKHREGASDEPRGGIDQLSYRARAPGRPQDREGKQKRSLRAGKLLLPVIGQSIKAQTLLASCSYALHFA